MQEQAHIILRTAREAHGFTRPQLVQAVGGFSVETLKNWEYGDQKPTPDDVANIERALGAAPEMLWHRWMAAAWDSYREHHPDARPTGLLGAIMAVRHELGDVLSLQDTVERDAIDGAIDDPALKAKYRRELEQAQASIATLLAQTKD